MLKSFLMLSFELEQAIRDLRIARGLLKSTILTPDALEHLCDLLDSATSLLETERAIKSSGHNLTNPPF